MHSEWEGSKSRLTETLVTGVYGILRPYKQLSFVNGEIQLCLVSKGTNDQCLQFLKHFTVSGAGILVAFMAASLEVVKMFVSLVRYAFKLTYDEAVLGAATSLDELADYLKEYDNDWYLGSDKDDMWQEAVMQGKQTLFSFGKDKVSTS